MWLPAAGRLGPILALPRITPRVVLEHHGATRRTLHPEPASLLAGQVGGVGVGLLGGHGRREERPDPRPVVLGGGPDQRHRYSPVSPSMDSRIRSAWPLCRAYSSIMCTRIQRRLKGLAAVGRQRTRLPVEPAVGERLRDDRVGGGDGLVEERPKVLGGVVGGAVPVPVPVGVPVDGRPRLDLGAPHQHVVEPAALHQSQVLDHAAEGHAPTAAAWRELGRRQPAGLHAGRCPGGSRGRRSGWWLRRRVAAGRCARCRSRRSR